MLDPSKPMPSMNRFSPSSLTGIEKCWAWPGRSTKRRSTMRTPLSRASAMTSATVVVGAATPLGIRSSVVIRSRTSSDARLVHRARDRGRSPPDQQASRGSGCGSVPVSQEFLGILHNLCRPVPGDDPREREAEPRPGPTGPSRRAPPAAEPGTRRYCGGRRAGPPPRPGARLEDGRRASASRSSWTASRPTSTGASSSRAWRSPSGRFRTLPRRR